MAKTARKMAMALVAGAVLAAPQVSAASDDGPSSSETRTQDAHVRSAVPALQSLIHRQPNDPRPSVNWSRRSTPATATCMSAKGTAATECAPVSSASRWRDLAESCG